MKKLFEFTPKNFLILSFLLAFAASFFQLNPAIDTGRELYIPFRMLNGEVLYRDIVNIYGALAYQVNALLYLIFGASFNVLRVAGIINSTLLIWLFMMICGEIFPRKEKSPNERTSDENNEKTSDEKSKMLGEGGYWQFAIIPLIIGVCSLGTFNYTFPYAFAMTYGLSAFLASVLFFVKFAKNDEVKFAYLACLLAGVAVSCKYDFCIYTIFLALYVLVNKRISTMNVLISLVSLAFVPFLSFGILFLQGVQMADLKEAFALLGAIGRTHSLKYFYSRYTGAIPCLSVFTFVFVKTIILVVIAGIVTFAKKMCPSDKFILSMVYVFAITGLVYVGLSGYSLLAIANSLIFCIFYKKIVQNRPLFVFMISSILISTKTFFAVNIDVYGTYTMPIIVFSIIAFLWNVDYTEKIEVKKLVNSFGTTLLVGLLILCGTKSILTLIPKMHGKMIVAAVKNTNSVTAATNSVFVYPQVSKTLRSVAEYVENNTNLTDKIVVIPETMYLNFVTKRPADNIFDSLTPMYFETFGEDFVIKHFSETKPEYFILNNRDTFDYGKRFICEDYGKQFCRFVEENYRKTAIFGEGQYVMQLYKRNDL